jgi:peptidoglycan/xylan/chitin deacetylase (PgdA/CDA1 family)
MLIPTILAAPLALGILATLIFGRRSGTVPPLPGLLFHSVQPVPAAEMSQYPLARFKKFFAALAERGYTGITVRDAATGTGSSESGRKPLLLTFDDGLQSIFTHALPVLQHYGHRATIFCVAGFYGNASSWDIFSGNRHLTHREIVEIAAQGHEIGSHTCSHAYLPYLNDGDLYRELAESKTRLEEIISAPVTSISFPFGGWNGRIWDIARQVGYTAATLYRGNTPAGAPLFPVQGVYQFETVDDILDKLELHHPFSPVRARSVMMSHFARGTPVWKFRREYCRVQG